METYSLRFVARSEAGITNLTERLISQKAFTDIIRPSDSNLVLWAKLRATDSDEAGKIAKQLHESHGQELERITVIVPPGV